MDVLEGKVAVVTGAASGIGAAMAEAFVEAGMKVVLADIELATLDAVATELDAAGGDVLAVRVDVSDAADVDLLGARAVEHFGALHVACNNAGVSGGGLSWEIDLETWRWVVDVDLWGVINGIRTFTPLIIDSGGGHIVNTASMAGLTSNAGLGPYNVAKHGVVTLSETMHAELSMTHPEVGISVLCPGWVRTRINDSERHRPDAPQPSAGGESDENLAALKAMVGQWIADGLEPSYVASLVVEAILERRFYILTHPEWQAMVSDRVERMLSGQDPKPRIPGN